MILAVYKTRKTNEILHVQDVGKEDDLQEKLKSYNEHNYDTYAETVILNNLEKFLYEKRKANISDFTEELQRIEGSVDALADNIRDEGYVELRNLLNNKEISREDYLKEKDEMRVEEERLFKEIYR